MEILSKADDARVRAKAQALMAWRRTLQNEPDTARSAVTRAMGLLSAKGCFSREDLARYYAQMMNGVAVPADFIPDNETGMARRA